MSKMKELSITLDEIIEAGEDLVTSYKKTASTAEIILNAIKELKELFTSAPAIPQESPAPKAIPADVKKPEETKTYTFTEVRGIMAGLSGQGKKAEAKALLQKYGASKLSDVKEADYAALIKDAEDIANG